MVRSGLEALIKSQKKILKGKRAGLVTHPAAVTRSYTHVLTALLEAGIKLSALYGPEHGILGAAADGAPVENTRDERTGLPVFSLYGSTRQPTPQMLEGVDVLLFDMQDVGVRFYTFLSTLVNVMKGAAASGVEVIVLDRPNPINGLDTDGPVLEPGLESFVGILPVPMRHGLTLGELALFANDRLKIGAAVKIIPVTGWKRSRWLDQTGLPWVQPSPSMPHLSTATVYPGMCLVEGTNLSEGRGTGLPFEVAGAPWLDFLALAERMNAKKLPGAYFRPIAFTPTTSKHSGEVCRGVQVHVTNRDNFDPVRSTLELLSACRDLAPDYFQLLPSSWEGHPPHFDLLSGSTAVRTQFLAGAPVNEMIAGWQDGLEKYRVEAREYWLYQE